MDRVEKLCDREVKVRGAVRPHGVVVEGGSTSLSLQGIDYEVDLCPDHVDELVSVLQPFLTIASKPEPKKTSVRKVIRSKGGQAFTSKDVREWLRAQGRDVPATGRLSQDVMKEYAAAKSS